MTNPASSSRIWGFPWLESLPKDLATHCTDDAVCDNWQTLAPACRAYMPLFIASVLAEHASSFGFDWTRVTSHANHGQSQKVHQSTSYPLNSCIFMNVNISTKVQATFPFSVSTRNKARKRERKPKIWERMINFVSRGFPVLLWINSALLTHPLLGNTPLSQTTTQWNQIVGRNSNCVTTRRVTRYYMSGEKQHVVPWRKELLENNAEEVRGEYMSTKSETVFPEIWGILKLSGLINQKFFETVVAKF